MLKKNNPPNVPQARPIEEFWDLCKKEYEKRQNLCKDVTKFKRTWTNISKNMAETHAKSLMRNIRRKIKLIGDNGVYATFKDKD